MGDPGGIGPEVILKAISELSVDKYRLKVYGDLAVFNNLSQRLSLRSDIQIEQVGQISWYPEMVGRYTEAGALAAVDCLRVAADELESGKIDALVTGPIHKRALRVANQPGPGHTEWLAARFGAQRVVMMLAGPKLKVVLATTHLPLRRVVDSLCKEDLVKKTMLAAEQLERWFYKRKVKIALAALNPHGEEDGQLGKEEREILIPAIGELRKLGIDVHGPVSGDVVFAQVVQGLYDVAVALYHDQGLGPIKTLHFSEAVNVTLGLGYIRTSPDHGVAYDIAHQGIADATSMKAAIATAAHMIESGQSG
jgi:4-hydroxythreonine-4-phosphate dehydrogenase